LSFGLSIGAGIGVGINLTPLPWKITDDLSIWTQNWPWTPVPPDGEVTHAESVCTLCPGGCGISVRKMGRRAVKIEGIKGYPVNDGGVCILGLAGLQLLYGPTRIRAPLRRTGRRGEGSFETITWEEALAELADRLSGLRAEGAPHSVACMVGRKRGTVPGLFRRFMEAYGSPNCFWEASAHDTYALTLRLMQGVDGAPGFDLERSDYVLSFGSGLVDGWGAPVRMFRAHSRWREDRGKERTRVVQIEPRLSNTAAKSDLWIPINPGTEGALALGVAHVLVKEALHKADLVRDHAFGFEDWTQGGVTQKGFKTVVLEKYAPARVAEITGVAPDVIVQTARAFAKARHPLAVCGRGQGERPLGLHECMAVHALNALAGSINIPGGIACVPADGQPQWAAVEQDEAARAGTARPRIDGPREGISSLAEPLVHRLPQAIAQGKGYPVQALLVAGANPFFTLPDTRKAIEALTKIPFIASFASHMDETAMHADVILPDHAPLERLQDVPTPPGMPYRIVGLARAVVEPLYKTRHTGDVLIQLAQAMGASLGDAFPWDSYEQCLQEAMGDNWEAMQEKGYWTEEQPAAPSWKEGFSTASGRFEFAPAALLRQEPMAALPQYVPPKADPDADDYPLTLIPCQSMRLANGAVGDPPFLVKTLEETVLKGNDLVVEIHPKTARISGVREGQTAMLWTPVGKAKVRVHLFEGIMPRLVGMPEGLGHTAYDGYLAGKGINYNGLIRPVEDPVTGHDVAWGVRARLTVA